MKIEKNRIVTMHYILKDMAGKIIESTYNEKPFEFLCGSEMIVKGLEKALIGLESGDTKTVVVPPSEGYGKRDKSLVLKIPRDQLPEEGIEVGKQFRKVNRNGISEVYTITNIFSNWVWLDKNHPLAGKKLHYEVNILDVRPNPLTLKQ